MKRCRAKGCENSIPKRGSKWCLEHRAVVREKKLSKYMKAFLKRRRKRVPQSALRRQVLRAGKLTKWALNEPQLAAYVWTTRHDSVLPEPLKAVLKVGRFPDSV